MADNVSIKDASGTTVPVASDDIAGIQHQRLKMGWGADGSYGDVSASNPLPVTDAAATTATVTSVNASASSVTLIAANTARRGACVYNDSTALLYVKLGATASTTSFTVLVPAGGFYEVQDPGYTGVIDGIWASATGAARCTELTGRQT